MASETPRMDPLIEIGQLSRKGEEYRAGDHPELAAECYKKAYKLAQKVEDDKTERTCAFNLGAAYIASGNVNDGLKYLHKAIPPEDTKDGRSNGDLYFNMGLCYEKDGKEDKAIKYFIKADDEYAKYERDKVHLRKECLEKCYLIYLNRNDIINLANILKRKADVYDGTDELKKTKKLCQRVKMLINAEQRDMAKQQAEDCMNALICLELEDMYFITKAKLLNDLGLEFTLLTEFRGTRENAVICFEEAKRQIQHVPCSSPEGRKLEALVMKNLGAALNEVGSYETAIEILNDAVNAFGQLKNRDEQGSCFMNLAFAKCQLRRLKEAEIDFHHALQAANDTRNKVLKWQSLEGLGDISFKRGNMSDAAEYIFNALTEVGDNVAALNRLKKKIFRAKAKIDEHGK